MKRKKVKLFSFFILCSFFAWFISNLSKTYINELTFDLQFENIPENHMLISSSKSTANVTLEMIGFQFLRYKFHKGKLSIDLNDVVNENGKYFIPPAILRKQIAVELPSSLRLIEVQSETLFFKFKEVVTKEVKVRPNVTIDFAQNYILEGELELQPSTIQITGPIEEVKSISELKTTSFVADNLSADFSAVVDIIKPKSATALTYSNEQITITAKVSRFSEKIITVPIETINLPENRSIRTFPNQVDILCKAKLNNLKNLKSSDFKVVTDFSNQFENNHRNYLTIRLQKKPDNIFVATLMENKVEFILKNK